MTTTQLPKGFELRDNGDMTHSLMFNGAPVTMEWIRSLPVMRSASHVDHDGDRDLFTEVAVITTGRSYTWYMDAQGADETWYYHGETHHSLTAVAGAEVLALRHGRFYIHAFTAPRFDVLIMGSGGGGNLPEETPDLYQPSEVTQAIENHIH